MRDKVMDILLGIGIPANVRGLTYICDAIELFDTDPYYQDGKICSLYHDIAKKRDTTASRVERGIRHAFETALTRGNREMVERYLDVVNTQNSNLLRCLHFRIHQEERRRERSCGYSTDASAMKRQIYQEAMDMLSQEVGTILARLMSSMEGDELPMEGRNAGSLAAAGLRPAEL